MKTVSPIEQATRRYARWLAVQTPIVAGDLQHKYVKMRSDPTGFVFFRGTFYRWVHLWEKKRKELQERGVLLSGAPELFCIGDLHVENFGTWRDREGRLVWGVNDVDEAYWMRYLNDLVRLATSALLALGQTGYACRKPTPKQVCAAILAGYTASVTDGGNPIVLEHKTGWLWKIATHPTRTPEQFFAALRGRLKPLKKDLSTSETKSAAKAMREIVPKGAKGGALYRRRAGVGSLGRPRLVQFFTWENGEIIREAKTVVPSACVFLAQGKPVKNAYEKILGPAKRVQDPFAHYTGKWVARRLAFDSDKVPLQSLDTVQDLKGLFRAMGYETGNLHLGSKDAADARRHIEAQDRREPHWLWQAAQEMCEVVRRDFEDYLESPFGRSAEPAQDRSDQNGGG